MAGDILSHAVKRSNPILLWDPYVGTTTLVTCLLVTAVTGRWTALWIRNRAGTPSAIAAQTPERAQGGLDTTSWREKDAGTPSAVVGKV